MRLSLRFMFALWFEVEAPIWSTIALPDALAAALT